MAIDAATLQNRAQGGSSSEPGVIAQQADSDGDMFMTLLMAQIKNQNPLEPTDPAQFVSQLVQMNQMQNSIAMLSEMKNNALMLRELQGLALGDQVGKPVLVQADSVRLDGSAVSGRITLEGNDEVQLQLTSLDGQSHSIALGKQPAGEFSFKLDPASEGLAPGVYQTRIITAGKSPARLEFAANVAAVRLPVQGGEPVLSLSGLGEFPVSAITSLLGNAGTLASGV